MIILPPGGVDIMNMCQRRLSILKPLPVKGFNEYSPVDTVYK